nr:MAG TPA: hypothetical protein [Caudoviricetes sp.]
MAIADIHLNYSNGCCAGLSPASLLILIRI